MKREQTSVWIDGIERHLEDLRENAYEGASGADRQAFYVAAFELLKFFAGLVSKGDDFSKAEAIFSFQGMDQVETFLEFSQAGRIKIEPIAIMAEFALQLVQQSGDLLMQISQRTLVVEVGAALVAATMPAGLGARVRAQLGMSFWLVRQPAMPTAIS